MDTLQNTTKATACVSDGDIDLAENGQSLSSILDLTGKVAIVTGGARGLGFHVVNRLAEGGDSVMIVDIATDYAEEAVSHFSKKGKNVKYTKCDIRYPKQINATVDATIKEY